MMQPSKGGSGGGLAQSFMQNTATQPATQLPQIMQPQQRPLPQVPQPRPQMPAPNMGSMAPLDLSTRDGMRQALRGAIAVPKSEDPNFRYLWDPRAQPTSDYARDQGRMGNWTMVPAIFGGMQQPQVQQRQFQPSQAQLMARAMNARAQGRG